MNPDQPETIDINSELASAMAKSLKLAFSSDPSPSTHESKDTPPPTSDNSNDPSDPADGDEEDPYLAEEIRSAVDHLLMQRELGPATTQDEVQNYMSADHLMQQDLPILQRELGPATTRDEVPKSMSAVLTVDPNVTVYPPAENRALWSSVTWRHNLKIHHQIIGGQSDIAKHNPEVAINLNAGDISFYHGYFNTFDANYRDPQRNFSYFVDFKKFRRTPEDLKLFSEFIEYLSQQSNATLALVNVYGDCLIDDARSWFVLDDPIDLQRCIYFCQKTMFENTTKVRELQIKLSKGNIKCSWQSGTDSVGTILIPKK